MQLSELSIRRPVFATVLSLALTLVGLMAYSRLSVRDYANREPEAGGPNKFLSQTVWLLRLTNCCRCCLPWQTPTTSL